MVDNIYMGNRKKWARPQAMLFSDNAGTFIGDAYVPTGTEWQDFIILSDHNRSEISISQQRIEDRRRMINGTMRSYWTADKLNISLSWNRLPSRAFSETVTFDAEGLPNEAGYTEYTVDNAAGGMDILNWYESHTGPFYVYLAYDKYNVDGTINYNKLGIYNQVVQMYFSSFDYNIEKRGADNFDFWNISIALEEV